MSKFSKYIRFLIAFKLILINGIAQIESQNFYEEYKNRTLKEVSYSFIDERLKLMKDFSDVTPGILKISRRLHRFAQIKLYL